MARYKVLQSVAHSLAQSFTSLMNYSGDDYVMGHVVQRARETGHRSLVLDLLAATGSPADLLCGPIAEMPQRYAEWLRHLIKNHKTDIRYVSAAQLTVDVDLTRERPWAFAPNLIESPYRCTVVVTDDRGKPWTAVQEGWWAPEGGNPAVDPGAPALRDSTPTPPGKPWWHFL